MRIERDEHREDVLDRAARDMREESSTNALPQGLIERTQSRVREAVAATEVRDRAIPFSPFRHPMFRVAAVFAVAACGLAAFLATRQKPEPVVHQPDHPAKTSDDELRNPADRQPTVPLVAHGDANVAGQITFVGVAPKPEVMSMAANAHCAPHHHGEVIDESILVNDDGTMRNVVVWVSKGLEGKRFAAPKEPAVLDQLGCVYTPHVVTVMKGQRLLVKNSDPFLHNVRAAAAENNPPFNFGQPTIDGGRPLVFFEPDHLFVKCDVHPWMSAHVLVLDNPFFAVSGTDGKFALPPGLPPGTYTVSAWHEVYGEKAQQVTVEAGKPVELAFSFNEQDRGETTASAEASAGSCCQTKPPQTLLAAATPNADEAH